MPAIPAWIREPMSALVRLLDEAPICLTTALTLLNEAQILRSYHARTGRANKRLEAELDLLVDAAGGLVELTGGRAPLVEGMQLTRRAREATLGAQLTPLIEEVVSGEDKAWGELLAGALSLYLGWQGSTAFVEQADAADEGHLTSQLLAFEDRLWRLVNSGGSKPADLDAVREEGRAIKTWLAVLAAPRETAAEQYQALREATTVLIGLLVGVILRG